MLVKVLWTGELLFRCVVYFNLSASCKMLSWSTHKVLGTLSASRNSKLSRTKPSLEELGIWMSWKSLQPSESSADPTAREEEMPVLQGTKSFLGGNDYSFVPAEGAPQQTGQNLTVHSTEVITSLHSTLEDCSGKQGSRVVGAQIHNASSPA